MVATPYDLSFRVDKEKETLCSRHLSKDDVKAFRTVRACLLGSGETSVAAKRGPRPPAAHQLVPRTWARRWARR